MKISYSKNPLETVVKLDDNEIENLRLKLKIEIYEDLMFSAHFAITKQQKTVGNVTALTLEEGVAKAVEHLDPNYWLNDAPNMENHTLLDIRLEQLLSYYLDALASSHIGDCTAFPSPCLKCHAEEKLGINTLQPYNGVNPNKTVLHHIYNSFRQQKLDGLTESNLDEALSHLSSIDTSTSQLAYKWLSGYRDAHF